MKRLTSRRDAGYLKDRNSAAVVFKLGLISTTDTGRDKRAVLIILNSENPAGVVRKWLDIEVKQEI